MKENPKVFLVILALWGLLLGCVMLRDVMEPKPVALAASKDRDICIAPQQSVYETKHEYDNIQVIKASISDNIGWTIKLIADDISRIKEQKAKEAKSEWKLLGFYTITHYCPCEVCNGKWAGQTASGKTPKPHRTVAMKGLPFGTKVKINGDVYVVEDRGVGPKWVDIFVKHHELCNKAGKYKANVYIYDP